MREIVLDTETTGLSPTDGHRIVEVACVELVNHVPTGQTFHSYCCPERPMPAEAFAVHGLSDAFLADKPPFAHVAQGFLAFIGDAPLVIHNAAFDLGFLNAELDRLGANGIAAARAIDTVQLARQKFPGAPASLDALCRRFQIDLSERAQHGALKDAKLLAEVYLHLKGGREPVLHLVGQPVVVATGRVLSDRTRRVTAPSATERAAHEALLDRLADPLWRKP
jgi:DNA polymerase-3 subunit epsilon